MDSFLIQNRNPKSGRIRLSVDRPVDRPKSRSIASVDRSIPRAKPYQSVDQAVDRSCSAVNRYCLCTLVHAGRPAGRPVSAVGHVFVFGYLYLSLPTILHLGEDFSNLSRTQHRIDRLESGYTSVAVYVPCPRNQAIRNSSKTNKLMRQEGYGAMLYNV